MVYSEPVFRIGGNSFVTVELGDDGSLHLNLYIHTLEKKLLDAGFPWLIDTTSLRTTIMIQYEPDLARAETVIAAVKETIASGIELNEVITAKLIHLPALYNDPETREAARQYDMPPNLELIARDNGISIDEVIQIHTAPRYFVSYISFIYGSFGAFPIDPAPVLKNSKYKIPRKTTPPGTLGIGGTTTFCYPVSAPGGLMMLGSIPCRMVDPEARNPFFKDDPLLVRPGSVLKIFSVDKDEYNYIRANADEYTYKIEETQIRWKES